MTWAALLLAASTGLVTPALADPTRDGSGSHRDALNKMELKPFAGSTWSKLTDWQNGELAEGLTKDKVVLILAYNDFAPAPKRAFALAKRLAGEHGSEGLIVVAAHAIRGWEDAEKPKVEDGSLRIAHDAKGEFRSALLADSDPDFYLIDRSGQMRFAGIATESVEDAVKQLLAESAATAGGTKAALDAAAQARDAAERTARATRANVDLTRFPELPYNRPSEEEYSAANWPKLPRDTSKQQELVYLEPRDVALPETGWFPSKPNLSGKLIYLYFWHPDVINFFDDASTIDTMARQYQRDVLFVGVVTDLDGFRVGGRTVKLLKDQKDPEKLGERIQQFVKNRNFDHYILVDSGRSVYDAAFKQQQDAVTPLVLLSTDGKARWWGDQPAVAWDAAFARMLQVDPGVLSRRKAEDEWLLKQNKGPAPAPK